MKRATVKVYRLFTLTLVFAFILTGCAETRETGPDTAAQLATDVAGTVQAMDNQTATAYASSTPTSTQTPLPSATSTPTPLPTSTALPTEAPTPTPTWFPSPYLQWPRATFTAADVSWGEWCPARGQNVTCEFEYRNYSGECLVGWTCYDACGLYYAVDTIGDRTDSFVFSGPCY